MTTEVLCAPRCHAHPYRHSGAGRNPRLQRCTPAWMYAYRDVGGRAASGTSGRGGRAASGTSGRGILSSSFRRRPESSGLDNPFPPGGNDHKGYPRKSNQRNPPNIPALPTSAACSQRGSTTCIHAGVHLCRRASAGMTAGRRAGRNSEMRPAPCGARFIQGQQRPRILSAASTAMFMEPSIKTDS